MKIQVSERQIVSPRTGKCVKVTLSKSVSDHMFNNNQVIAWEDFSIIG